MQRSNQKLFRIIVDDDRLSSMLIYNQKKEEEEEGIARNVKFMNPNL